MAKTRKEKLLDFIYKNVNNNTMVKYIVKDLDEETEMEDIILCEYAIKACYYQDLSTWSLKSSHKAASRKYFDRFDEYAESINKPYMVNKAKVYLNNFGVNPVGLFKL